MHHQPFVFFAATLTSVFLLSGCPAEVSVDASPSAAMRSLVESAKNGDEETFKQGLSKNFHLTIERYQEFSEENPSLRGAFSYATFMRAMALSNALPKEELITGKKAIVRAEDINGKSVKTKMVHEEGGWKLEVPDGMVTGLSHFDEVEALAAGKDVAARPKTQRGGGGKADRMKNLSPNATDAERQKAKALDAFDLGDLTGGEQLLVDALKAVPDDLEVTVALGRLYVQKNIGDKAVTLYEAYLKKHADAVQVKHYLGMAYMFQNKPLDAAKQWRDIVKLDAAYAEKFKLSQRAMAAENIASQGAPSMHQRVTPGKEGGAGHGAPGSHSSIPAAASQPASKPAGQ